MIELAPGVLERIDPARRHVMSGPFSWATMAIHFVEESARFPRNDRVSTIYRYFLRWNETACDSVKSSINSTKQDIFTNQLVSAGLLRILVGEL